MIKNTASGLEAIILSERLSIVFSSCKNTKDAIEATDSRVVPEIFPNPLRPFLRGRAAR